MLSFERNDKPWVKMVDIQAPELPELALGLRNDQSRKGLYAAEEAYSAFREELEMYLSRNNC